MVDFRGVRGCSYCSGLFLTSAKSVATIERTRHLEVPYLSKYLWYMRASSTRFQIHRLHKLCIRNEKYGVGGDVAKARRLSAHEAIRTTRMREVRDDQAHESIVALQTSVEAYCLMTRCIRRYHVVYGILSLRSHRRIAQHASAAYSSR